MTLSIPPVIEALLDPLSYPHVPESVELKQTHISYLLFTPEDVYKIKKPLDFGFLDFTTLERREHFCRQEVILNRRLSEGVYLGVVEIRQEGDSIRIDGPGETVEYAVKMQRLPAEKMMDAMIESGKINEEMIRRTAGRIALFHSNALSSSEISAFGSPEVIARNTEENFSQTEGYIGRTVSRECYDEVKKYTRDFLRDKRSLFLKRIKDGMIRDCHGDLHSEHICFTDGVLIQKVQAGARNHPVQDGVVIFDCIEFNERFRYSDVIADVAFLAMDLDFHHRSDLSGVLCREYEESAGDEGVGKLLNFYKVYRAYVRGKVEGFELDEPEVSSEEKAVACSRAKRFFKLAHEYVAGGLRPYLIVTCGMVGTGKTVIANLLAPRIGAGVLSSDFVRKEIAGIPVTEKHIEEFEEGIYSKLHTQRTYHELLKRAEDALTAGKSILLDATFSRRVYRDEVIKLAERMKSNLIFLECTCPDDLIKERLLKRRDAENIQSDARWQVFPTLKLKYEKITAADTETHAGTCHAEIPESCHLIIDTSNPLEDNIRKILHAL